MPEQPVVTVVIPTLHRPELLRRAVASVLAQDAGAGVEVLVVFDGTEPELPDLPVPDGFELRATVNSRRPGLAGARNTGVAEARGAFIAQCDDDDEWLPGKLRRQLGAVEDPAVVAVTTGIEVVYDGRTFERIAPSSTMSFDDLLASRRLDAHPSTFLFRRSALLEGIGLVDEDLPGGYAEDYELLLRAARLGPVVTIQEPLARVHWHRSSFFEGRWQTVASALEHLLTTYPEFERSPRGLARISGQIAFAHASLGDRRSALDWVRRTWRANWREPRAVLALAVSAGVPSASVVRGLHRAGKGV